MGGRKERWQKEQRRDQYKRARRRGKPRHSAQNFIRATDAQWAAIKEQVRSANKAVRKEQKKERKHDSNQENRRGLRTDA